ncbi:exonuclease SbcCD subunit D [Streptomyces sp. NPDC020983]|uniref:exonuclease SbcCD subunit D n=1 Tax=Streptomyces sp. NPDC020983 TaxID=3365106 RepID=UPI00378CB31A
MRLLHTSDWHLGRRFHGTDLIDAQRAFLDHLYETARAEKVDAILVAGDVYDRAIPSLDAVRLFNHCLEQLADLSVPTVIISGNHDSAHRLGVGSKLLSRAGVHLVTDPGACADPLVLQDPDGPVALYGIPYLEPSMVHVDLEAGGVTHQAVLTAALARIRADLAARPAGMRSVVLAHAFITGASPAQTSRSERDVSVGGVAHAGAATFDDITYTALGHLHRPQQVTDRIHYSGSPLAYSFSETGHTKSLTLVDLAADATPKVTRIPFRDPLPLACLEGPLSELLADPAHEPLTNAWLQITLTDPDRPYEAMARLKQRFPHTLDLQFKPAAVPAQTRGGTYRDRVHGRSDLEIACDFVLRTRGTPPSDAERDLLVRAVDATRIQAQRKETV